MQLSRDTVERVELTLANVREELFRAMEKHPTPMHSAHEGYAVILEEMDEVKAEVWKRKYDPALLRKELIQVAAMAVQMVENLGL